MIEKKEPLLSDNKTFSMRYKGIELWKFWFKVYFGYLKAYLKLLQTLALKKCYYGPFKGEYGHFLAHTLPFITYLHSKGVKIFYCGMEIHKPLMVDEKNNLIVEKFYPLRDFFAEVAPRSNSTIPPKDVQEEINKFEDEANGSLYPYWNIGEDFYYWFIHRNWTLKGPFMKSYHLEKVYQTKPKKENSVVVFPRSKGAKASRNNGEPWDYEELIEKIKPYFEKVYVAGHPSQCLALNARDNVEICVTANNALILEKCSNSKLIITQHSGVNNLGEYTDCKVLIIFKGELPIGSMNNTLRFRPYIGKKHELSFAYSVEEIVSFVKRFTNNNELKFRC